MAEGSANEQCSRSRILRTRSRRNSSRGHGLIVDTDDELDELQGGKNSEGFVIRRPGACWQEYHWRPGWFSVPLQVAHGQERVFVKHRRL